MAHDPPPIITVTEELLGWTLDRTASLPRSPRHSYGQRLDQLTLEVLEHAIAARFEPAARRPALAALNLALEKLRVLWRLAQARGWLSTRQLLYVAGRLDEIGRMAGGWLRATGRDSP